MSQEELEIEISRDGKVTVRTKGVKGTRCLDIAEVITQLVGVEESRRLTNEYYESPVEVQNQTNVHQRYS